MRREAVWAHHRAGASAVRALIVLAVVAVGTVVGASPASAAGSIMVAPTTGLSDGAVVSITGSGWQPGATVGFCEAVPSASPSQSDCGSGIGITTVDGNGNFSVSQAVQRVIDVPSAGRVDCAAPAAPCAIAAADSLNIAGTAVFEFLHFAPVPPLILPGSNAVLEGDSGTTSLPVPLTLSFASAQTVTADWAAAFVSGGPACQADPATDYTPASDTVTFAPGETAETVTISLNAETLIEPDECIVVSFQNATNATIGGDGTGTILNDDHPLLVVPGVGSVVEGDSGTVGVDVPVMLSQLSDATVSVDWVTFVHAGSPGCQADPATDYTPAIGTVTFAPGDTAETVTISVNGETLVEPDECIIVSFRNPTNAALGGFYGLGVGTILNDDHLPVVVPGFGSVVEGDSGTAGVDVPVTLSKPSDATVSVDWVTFVHAGSPGCQADPATDYTPAEGTVTFAPGETAKTVTISVDGETLVEPDECIVVSFRNPTNAALGGYFGLGVGTITNDD